MNRVLGVVAVLVAAGLLFSAVDAGAQQQPAPKPGAPAPAPGAPAKPAGEEKSVEGKVQKWDAAANMLTLEDGTQISVPKAAKVKRDQLKGGVTVKASYEEKEGKKVAKSIEVTPAKQ